MANQVSGSDSTGRDELYKSHIGSVRLPCSAFRNVLTTSPDVAEPLVLPDIGKEEKTSGKTDLERGWIVICWDDPVNLMDYVTHVFQVVFGWQKPKAEYHMLQVHNNGKSVLARTTMEEAEHYVHQLQKYSLHATMERES
ncbi:MAG: ATP-dependent Clp protease adapter ClpS [Verrucomicrobia bacterium]|nr:ATP-dependent Clp protease adapter ClpS [Verrucomicrobiota bacterium]